MRCSEHSGSSRAVLSHISRRSHRVADLVLVRGLSLATIPPMTPRNHFWLSLASAALVICLAHSLDAWVAAGAARTVASSYDHSYAWATALSRVILSVILVAVSCGVLHRLPSCTLASIFLIGGLVPTLAYPLGVSGFSFLLLLPFPRVTDALSANTHFTFAFLGAIGIAAFVRRHLNPPSTAA